MWKPSTIVAEYTYTLRVIAYIPYIWAIRLQTNFLESLEMGMLTDCPHILYMNKSTCIIHRKIHA